MKSFSEKVTDIRCYITKYKMIEKGDGIILGLSGGPDSVCLLFVLLELREEYDLELTAVHYNHKIRGKSANADQNFVEKLCDRIGVRLVCYEGDIPARAKKTGRSLEEEGRIARYESFRAEAQSLEKFSGRKVKIAVAHNADDNAETVLFHMARGCGLDGMCGIAPVRDDIIRPLLSVTKAEIIGMLLDLGEDYCVDESNSDVAYDRNRLRHNVLPELGKINDKALEHILMMTQRLRSVADFINDMADETLAKVTDDQGLRRFELEEVDEVVVRQILKKYLSSFMPMGKDVSESHLLMVENIIFSTETGYVDLPHGFRAVCSGKYLKVEEKAKEKTGEKTRREVSALVIDSDAMTDGEERIYTWGHLTVKTRFFKASNEGIMAAIPPENYTKWLDCDKIKQGLVLRFRQEGDFLTVTDDGRRKKLKEYMINEKIPKDEREITPVLCDGSEVVWVVGRRIGATYKIMDCTKRILEISIDGGN